MDRYIIVSLDGLYLSTRYVDGHASIVWTANREFANVYDSFDEACRATSDPFAEVIKI